MSKKKAKKAPTKKAAPKKAKASKPVKAARPRAKSPSQPTIPGMEQVRNPALDRICEAISDTRADLNRLRGEEKDLQGQAVRVMSAGKGITAYRFAGVELVLVPGDVHLRVRTLKVTANTDAAPDDAEPSALDEMGVEDEPEPEGDEA